MAIGGIPEKYPDPLLKLVSKEELDVYWDGAKQTSSTYVHSTTNAAEIAKQTGSWFDFAVFHMVCYQAKLSPSTGLLYSSVSVRELHRLMKVPHKKDSPSANKIARSLDRLKSAGLLTLKMYSRSDYIYIIHPSGGIHKFGTHKITKSRVADLLNDYKREKSLRTQNDYTGSNLPSCSQNDYTDLNTQTPKYEYTETPKTPKNEDTINKEVKKPKKTTTTTSIEQQESFFKFPDCSCSGSTSENTYEEEESYQHNLYRSDHIALSPKGITRFLALAGSKEILNKSLRLFDENKNKAARGEIQDIGDDFKYLTGIINRLKEEILYLAVNPATQIEEENRKAEEAPGRELDPREKMYLEAWEDFFRFFNDFPVSRETEYIKSFVKENGRKPEPETVRKEAGAKKAV